ncbi:hypothetical protein EON66_12275, partial [archaeon]
MATGRAVLLPYDPILSTIFVPVPPNEGGLNWEWRSAMHAFRQRMGRDAVQGAHVQVALDAPDWAGCDDWNDPASAMYAADVLTVESTQYFWPLVAHNEKYRSKLVGALGGSTAHFFERVVRTYLRLQPALEHEVRRFVDTTLRPLSTGSDAGLHTVEDRFVIGLQIRTEHLVRQQHEVNVFLKCARALAQMWTHEQDAATAPATQQGDVHDAGVRLARQLVHSLSRGHARSLSRAWFFVATDSEEVRKAAAAAFGDRLLLYTPPPPGAEPSAGLSLRQIAAVEMWLLGQCDELVLTWPKSTFGSVGAALLPSHVLPPSASP